MRYSELIKELEYWKAISEEEDPEIVAVDNIEEDIFMISYINPAEGIDDERAIGIYYE